MITIADALADDGIALHLQPRTHAEAVQQIATLLHRDTRVIRWEPLRLALTKGITCLVDAGAEFGVCIPHARTDAVIALVMSIGRFEPPVVFPDCPQPIRYVFCIGVPVALASDYLRIVGLLTRMLRNPATETQLRRASTATEFVALLSRLEAAL